MDITIDGLDIALLQVHRRNAVDEDTVGVNLGTGDVELAVIHVGKYKLTTVFGGEVGSRIAGGVTAVDDTVEDNDTLDGVTGFSTLEALPGG